MKKDGVNRQINLQELKANSTSEKPWFVVNGEVYDGTGFLEGHPGGAISITSSAGLDVSEEFLAIRESQLTCHQIIAPLTFSQTVKLPR